MSVECKGIDDDQRAFCNRDQSGSNSSDESRSTESDAEATKTIHSDKSTFTSNPLGLKSSTNCIMKRLCSNTSTYHPISTCCSLTNEDASEDTPALPPSTKHANFSFSTKDLPTISPQTSNDVPGSLTSAIPLGTLHTQVSFDNQVDETGDFPLPKTQQESNFCGIASADFEVSTPTSAFQTYSRFIRDEIFTWILVGLRAVFFNQQVIKMLLAMLYFFGVMVFVSHLLVLVHHRTPTNETWGGVNPRPLPDIILENVPRQNWGFQAAEILISMLSVCAFSVALLHQHTLVTVRRLFCIFASVFFIRAFSTVSTSLTQSSPHLEQMCPKIQIENAFDFTRRAFRILFGLGMRAKGGMTCGDFIYSGHTCSLILFNLFIVTYGPRRMLFLPLKAASSIACILGMSFILVAHEHYTVDVVLAIVISVLLFNEYHNVAHNQELRQRDRIRIILSAPITYFMEHDGEGKLVNKFRIPFCHSFVCGRWEQFRLFRQRRNNVDNQADAVLPL